jgi:hypothetical protein
MIGQHIKEALSPIVFLVAGVGLIAIGLGFCDGCASPQAAAAEAAYTADHLRCVDKAATLEESRECRASVDRKYGIVQTVRDGGAR